MGNFDLDHEVACALRLLELVGRTEVPVCAGFDRPLIHERSSYADQVWGKWGTLQPVESIPPGLPTLQRDPRHAVDFIIECVQKYPNEVTILATGPLTNVAVAIRKYPQLVEQVREIIIMGGNIPSLPRGHGNITPLAEFNIWVDPEAAQIVLRSAAPITLLPLNVCRLTHFDRAYFDRLASTESNHPEIAKLFRDYLQVHFENPEVDRKNARLFYGLYDHCVVGYAINPDLYTVTEMQVDVNIVQGAFYGATHGYQRGTYSSGAYQFPLDDGSRPIKVAHEMDFEGLVDIYIRALTE